MTSKHELISVRNALIQIDDLLDKELPPRRPESIEEFLSSSAAENKSEYYASSYIMVDSDLYQHAGILRRSVDLAWSILSGVDTIYVSAPGDDIEEVLTSDFGKPPGDRGLFNEYFDLLTGKTITEDFVVKTETAQRSGSLGETVYLRKTELEPNLLMAGSSESLAESGAAKRYDSDRVTAPAHRPRKIEKAAELLRRHWPDGVYPTWKNVQHVLLSEERFDVGRTTLSKAVKSIEAFKK